MAMSDDEETQKKGVVSIMFACMLADERESFDKAYAWKLPGLMRALPVRQEALHLCHDSLVSVAIISIFKLSASLFHRLRIRTHYGMVICCQILVAWRHRLTVLSAFCLVGSQKECRFTLSTYGIPSEFLPITENGQISTDVHTNMLQKRKKREQTASTNDYISVPGRFDVIFGRGRGNYRHVGNIHYRHLIQNLADTYEKGSVSEKKRLTESIVRTIKDASGRFLKDSDAGWVQVPDDVARFKVSHSFRTKRKMDIRAFGAKKATKERNDDLAAPPAKRKR